MRELPVVEISSCLAGQHEFLNQATDARIRQNRLVSPGYHLGVRLDGSGRRTMSSIQAVNQLLGGCSEFYAQQTRRLLDLGMDVRNRAVSHLAYRAETLAEYLETR